MSRRGSDYGPCRSRPRESALRFAASSPVPTERFLWIDRPGPRISLKLKDRLFDVHPLVLFFLLLMVELESLASERRRHQAGTTIFPGFQRRTYDSKYFALGF